MSQPDVDSVVDLQISDCHRQTHIQQPQDGIWHSEVSQPLPCQGGDEPGSAEKSINSPCSLFAC